MAKLSPHASDMSKDAKPRHAHTNNPSDLSSRVAKPTLALEQDDIHGLLIRIARLKPLGSASHYKALIVQVLGMVLKWLQETWGGGCVGYIVVRLQAVLPP